jgi:alpha-ketoglutarate-dependent taurine dioxygenase
MTRGITIQPFDHHFGAEVSVDLRAERTKPEDDALRDALAVHGLLLVRQPGLTNVDLSRFGSVFGPLLPVGTSDRMEQYVSNVRGDVAGVGARTLQKFTVGQVSLFEQFPELLSALSDPYQTAAT